MVSAMRANASLRVLDLRSNRLDDEAAVALHTYLHGRSSRLTSLMISDNQIGPDGAKAIARAWTDNDVLSSLDVRGNPLDAEAVRALKAARGASHRKKARTVELLIDDE